uniref:Uncharacterized protein n=1 Tax=Anopheles atroparvus TaxID=41427 RepID=A0AAG5D6V3_ANOAO
MRRTQQLVSTLNAFQLKDKDKDKGSGKDGGEERHDRATSGIGKDATSSVESHPTSLSTTSTNKPEANKATAGVGSTATNGDLQTPKEQECYRLFLKMSKKGLAVSYDTILRGMLTPTELRVLQKKKNREQRNNINGTESVENDGGPLTPSPENDAGFESGAAMAFEEIRGLKELHFDRNSQTQDGQALLQLQAAPAPDQCADGESETEDEENTS